MTKFQETEKGVTLHYRSKRRGYAYYVVGQLKQISKIFYDKEVDITVSVVEDANNISHYILQINFDNSNFHTVQTVKAQSTLTSEFLIRPAIFLDAFPFHVVFDKNFIIRSVGRGLAPLLPDLLGKRLDKAFSLRRPAIKFSFEQVIYCSSDNKK